jgi:hypothetical protein
MAVPANTAQTYALKGIREDLSDMISNIDPTDCPFTSSVGNGKADNTFHEWQNVGLNAVNLNNAQIQGDDAATDPATVTSRIGNYTQILRKVARVARTTERVKKAGRKSEMAFQLSLRTVEQKRDLEAMLLQNQTAVPGSAAVAGKFGGILGFIKTNVSKGATGADPVYTTAPTGSRTDGTPRAAAEADLKTVLGVAFSNGAKPTVMMADGPQKQTLSTALAGIATKTYSQSKPGPAKIVAAADVYVSDFGSLSIVPNRFQRHKDVLILDFDYLHIDYLDPFHTEDLAKTGDSTQKMIIGELTFRCDNEKSQALWTDLT